MNQMDLLIERIIEKRNPTVAGLDTRVEYLPDEFKASLGMGEIDTFEKAADGRATKIIVPSEIQGLVGLVRSLTEAGVRDDVLAEGEARRETAD